jgi:glycosyltransferase involved in cell wall biosynthesis
MNVLIVTQYFWPENFRINELAATLVERGHDVTVLTGIPNYPGGRFFPGYGIFTRTTEEYQGCRVIRVPLVPRGKSTALQLAVNGLSFVLSASLLYPRIGRKRYDVIFVWESSPVTVALPAILIKRLRKIPLVFWILDLWPESLYTVEWSKSSIILRVMDRLVRFIYRWCDLVLVASRGYTPSVVSHGADPSRVRYFPNWAEDVYRPVSPAAAADVRPGLPEGFRVMFAGNIGEAQDPPTILAAAERLKAYPDVHWILVGDGRMRGWVSDQIAARGLSSTVHLVPRQPAEAMPALFAQADAMLVTLRRNPTFALTVPGKIQSYMSCARPIVAALEGEGRRIVEEAGAGLVCDPENAEALAQAVLDMRRSSAAERREMGERGRRYCAENFERGMLMDRLEAMLHEVQGPRAGHALELRTN